MTLYTRLALLCLGLTGLLPGGLVVANAADTVSYRELEWIDLLPADDLATLENRPLLLDQIEEGSDADNLDSLMNGQTGKLSLDDMAQLQRYQAALQSTRTRPELAGQAIRIPGFVVPLEFDDQQRITELFLVPFFGACIHVPPPPPNQIIHARLREPLVQPSIYDPVWLEGILQTGNTDTELGLSAYEMDVRRITPYE